MPVHAQRGARRPLSQHCLQVLAERQFAWPAIALPTCVATAGVSAASPPRSVPRWKKSGLGYALMPFSAVVPSDEVLAVRNSGAVFLPASGRSDEGVREVVGSSDEEPVVAAAGPVEAAGGVLAEEPLGDLHGGGLTVGASRRGRRSRRSGCRWPSRPPGTTAAGPPTRMTCSMPKSVDRRRRGRRQRVLLRQEERERRLVATGSGATGPGERTRRQRVGEVLTGGDDGRLLLGAGAVDGVVADGRPACRGRRRGWPGCCPSRRRTWPWSTGRHRRPG